MHLIRLVFHRLLIIGLVVSVLAPGLAYAGGPKPRWLRAKRNYHLREKSHLSREHQAVSTTKPSPSVKSIIQDKVAEVPAPKAAQPAKPAVESFSRPKITPYDGPTLTKIQWATKFTDAKIPLPEGWQDMSSAGFKFHWNLTANYYLMKSSGEMPSRFRVLDEDGTLKKGTDTELFEWARTQPDWHGGEFYLFDGPYMGTFHPEVKSLRVLVINDSRTVMEPLLEVAAKNSRVEVFYKSSPEGVVDLLQQKPDEYDVILTDYCMHDGTAVALGMQAYSAGVTTPIIFYSRAGATAEWLLQFNIVGRADVAVTSLDARGIYLTI